MIDSILYPFTQQTSGLPLALTRISIATVALFDFYILLRHRALWFDEGVASCETGKGTIDLFAHIGVSRHVTTGVLTLYGCSCVLLFLGLFTTQAALLMFLLSVSLISRIGHSSYGGDMFLRLTVLWLAVTQSNAALSLDCYFSHGNLGLGNSVPSYHVYLFWIQMTSMYFCSGLGKLSNRAWRTGSPIYLSARYKGISRLPESSKSHVSLGLSRVLSWVTLFAEIAVPFVLWTSLWWTAFILLFTLHVAIHITMSVQMFSLLAVAGLLSFLRFPLEPPGQTPECGLDLALFFLLYLFIIIQPFRFFPTLTDPLRRIMHPLVTRLIVSHTWNMFVFSGNACNHHRIKISFYDSSSRSIAKVDWEDIDFSSLPVPYRHRHRRLANVLAHDGAVRERFYAYATAQIAPTLGIEPDVIGLSISRQMLYVSPHPRVADLGDANFIARSDRPGSRAGGDAHDLYLYWSFFGRDGSTTSAMVLYLILILSEAARQDTTEMLGRLRYIKDQPRGDSERSPAEFAMWESLDNTVNWSTVAPVDPASEWPGLNELLNYLSSVNSVSAILETSLFATFKKIMADPDGVPGAPKSPI